MSGGGTGPWTGAATTVSTPVAIGMFICESSMDLAYSVGFEDFDEWFAPELVEVGIMRPSSR